MDHLRIIRRAFDITRFYPALWVFGILLALTAARGSGNGGGGSGSGASGAGNGGAFPFFQNPQFSFGPGLVNTLVAVGISLACLILVLIVVFAILRYVSMTALFRMVDSYETSGEKVSVGQGFRLGWVRASFRTWLVDLMLGVAGIIVFVLLLALAAAPLLGLLIHNQAVTVISIVATIGLGLLFILFLILVAAVLSVLLELIHRAIVLEGLGVFDGIRRGWQLFRRHLGDAIIMGLLLFGIGLVYSILMIPVFFVLLLMGVTIGGIPGLLAGGIASLFAHGAFPVILGVIVGLPFFLIILIVPLTFLGGLFETYKSSAWTLTFREMVARDALLPAPMEPAI